MAVRTSPSARSRDRQPQAEQAEPVEQLLADLLAERVQVGIAEPVDRAQEVVPSLLVEAAIVAQPAELLLAQGRAGLGDEPGDGHDPGRQLAHAGFAA